MTTFAHPIPTASRVVPSALLRVAPLTGLAAAAINAVIYFGAKALAMIPDTALVEGKPLTVVPVIIASIVPVLIGAGIFALLGRFTKHPMRIFTILTLVMVGITIPRPFTGIAGVIPAMGIALNLMHVVVAGLTLYAFRRYATTPTGA